MTRFAPDGLRVTFDGTNTDTFDVQLLLTDSTGTLLPSVLPVLLDAAQAGSLLVPARSGYDTATLVLAAVEPSATPARYVYSAQLVPPIELRAGKDPASPGSGIILTWTTANPPPFDVLRGSNPALLRIAPGQVFPGITDTFFADSATARPLLYYVIEKQ
jgi:hypothetical protein